MSRGHPTCWDEAGGCISCGCSHERPCDSHLPHPAAAARLVDRNRTPISSPPVYCSKDRMQLLDHRSERHNGYDVFTGVELPKGEHITRRCPTLGHDTWVLVDRHWIRV